MQALNFWKAVTVDRSNLLERFVELLRARDVSFCLVGGQAVNPYVEPVVSLDLDIVVASGQLPRLRDWLAQQFTLETFPHSLNVSSPDSDLRIRIQLDPRYAPFVARAAPRAVLGLTLPVATVEDVLQGKIWAATDSSRRPSKRLKDLADIARLVERYPHLREPVPPPILARLV